MKMLRNRREIKFIAYMVAIFGAFTVISHLMKDGNYNNNNNRVENSEKIYELKGTTEEIIGVEDQVDDGKISYEDEKFNEYEARRRGPGEHGEPVELTDPNEIKENQEWLRKEGFYVIVSDKISVDRAIPDLRVPACKSIKYLKNLPKTSVIVTFHNEIWSVLLRCIHSIFNRSPSQLLHEIILINDASTYENLGKQLEDYIAKPFFEGKIKMHKNEKREGLIRGRMIGARLAEGEVILFLDSHMEVCTGWLPPLLEPIALNPTFATVPVISGMNHKTMQPDTAGIPTRGHFDWGLTYKWYGTDPKVRVDLGENYNLACMTGGAYAINRKHFFDLEGYDEQLKIWNGENYELSFKLWTCSGGMQMIPCSQIHHLSKMHTAHRKVDDGSDFVGRNLKRVVEVWFDDYKKYFYATNEERYAKIDAGDLSKQFAFKERMKCKGFKYYLDHVATELLTWFPIETPSIFSGSLHLKSNDLCLTLGNHWFNRTAVLEKCSDNPQYPEEFSHFIYTTNKEIQFKDYHHRCLDAVDLAFYYCHGSGGNQAFVYKADTFQLVKSNSNLCITGKGLNDPIYMAECDDNADNQKWTWTVWNRTAIAGNPDFGVFMNFVNNQ